MALRHGHMAESVPKWSTDLCRAGAIGSRTVQESEQGRMEEGKEVGATIGRGGGPGIFLMRLKFATGSFGASPASDPVCFSESQDFTLCSRESHIRRNSSNPPSGRHLGFLTWQ